MDDFTYTYDAAGNKIKINRNHYGEKAFTSVFDETEGETGYKYDVLNQLVEVNKPNKTKEKYFYDKLGNRVGGTKGQVACPRLSNVVEFY